MKNLDEWREIQRSIQSAVQAKTGEMEMSHILLEKPPISVSQRLHIYQESYEARLEESLTDDFERVQSQLDSPKKFEKIIQEFILQCPSTVRNIAEYSEDFPCYLKKYHPDLFESALCDWYLLVAAKMPDVLVSQIVSVEEIQKGISFQVKTYPSTISFQSQNKYFMTLRSHDEVLIYEISLADYELIQFLMVSKSVEDFVEKAQSLQLAEAEIAQKINEWITKQVIYCERV